MYYSQDGCKNHHKHYNQLKAEGQEHYYKGDRTDGHQETMEDMLSSGFWILMQGQCSV